MNNPRLPQKGDLVHATPDFARQHGLCPQTAGTVERGVCPTGFNQPAAAKNHIVVLLVTVAGSPCRVYAPATCFRAG